MNFVEELLAYAALMLLVAAALLIRQPTPEVEGCITDEECYVECLQKAENDEDCEI